MLVKLHDFLECCRMVADPHFSLKGRAEPMIRTANIASLNNTTLVTSVSEKQCTETNCADACTSIYSK